MKGKAWFLWYIVFVLILIVITVVVCVYNYERKIVSQSINNSVETENNDIESETLKKIEIETNKEVDTNKAVEPISLGEFKLTAYCSCKKCCGIWAANRPNGIVYGAIGEELKAGYSIAVDPEVISYNSKVMINGQVYEAQDCGSAIKGNRIDVYFENHKDAINFGVQYAEVFLMPNSD